MPENETYDFSETSRRLERHYTVQPNPAFAARLEAQLGQQARRMGSSGYAGGRARAGWLAVAGRWGLGLAALAAVVLLIAFSMQALPRLGAAEATSTATPWVTATAPAGVLPSPTATDPGPTPPVPTPFIEPTPELSTPLPATPDLSAIAPQHVMPGVCPQAGPTSKDVPAFMQEPSRRLGGGELSQGDFTFTLYLACIPRYGENAYDSSLYSEYEGLGVYYTWSYHGASQPGEALLYQGFAPYILQTSTFEPLTEGSSDQAQVGINFPHGIFPTLAGQSVTLRYILKLQSPDGQQQGVGLRFTMQPNAAGFTPQDIQLEPLSQAERDDPALLTGDPAPFPTIDPGTIHPLLGEIAALNRRWEDQMLSSPGWLHLVTHIENARSGGVLPNGDDIPAVSNNDAWYLLDEQGRSLAWINRLLDETGRATQISVMKDGLSTNLTLGETLRVGEPIRTGFDSGFYNQSAWEVKLGALLNKEYLQLDGEQGPIPAIRFMLDYTGGRTEIVYNADTGQPLSTSIYRPTEPGGELVLQGDMTVLTIERLEAPPADILALLDQQPTPYQPLPPQGEPAPSGFDPAQSPLGLKMIAGDSAVTPSFWFGDLYALYLPGASGGVINAGPEETAGYLLGRVDFGMVAGGWCDRSADSSRLAFNYTVANNLTVSHTWLRWLDLRDVSQVQNPAPELNVVSPPTWAPQGHQLAFSACDADQACGVYLLDSDDGSVLRLSSRVSSSIPPLWKPDGSQVAIMTTMDDGIEPVISVIDIATRTIIMQTALDISVVSTWGVTFLEGMDAFERCSLP